MDLQTPLSVPLSGFFQRSHALPVLKKKLPMYLMVIINELSSRLQEVKQQSGQEAYDELKFTILKMYTLRSELIEDEYLRKLRSKGDDIEFYNHYLEQLTTEDCSPTFLKTRRLVAECYMYRRVWEAFEITNELTDFDPYKTFKVELFRKCSVVITKTAKYLRNIYKYPSEDDMIDCEKLLKLSLWSNRSDYIMAQINEEKVFGLLKNKRMEEFIVVNHFEEAWKIISNREHASSTVAFICDDFGFDFFMDLCVADYFFVNFYARSAHFHVRKFPWFILDVTENDINWFFLQLTKTFDKNIQHFVNVWKDHFKAGRWKIVANNYWSLPIGFSLMKQIDPDLYEMLASTKMIVVKGDLSYRKLIDDKNFDPSTPLEDVLNEFFPTNLLLVRIMKTDIACDIPIEAIRKFRKKNKNWMICGEYGLIQFVKDPKQFCICLEQ